MTNCSLLFLFQMPWLILHPKEIPIWKDEHYGISPRKLSKNSKNPVKKKDRFVWQFLTHQTFRSIAKSQRVILVSLNHSMTNMCRCIQRILNKTPLCYENLVRESPINHSSMDCLILFEFVEEISHHSILVSRKKWISLRSQHYYPLSLEEIVFLKQA